MDNVSSNTNLNNQNDKKSRRDTFRVIMYFVTELILTVLTASLVWACDSYGNISVDEIIFHLSMPKTGTADYLISSYVQTLVYYIVVDILLNIIIIAFCVKAKQEDSWLGRAITKIKEIALKLNWLRIATWFTVLILIFNSHFGFFSWVEGQLTSSNFIETEYVAPDSVNLTFPEQKRNLIHIIVESAETTNQDKANGGIFDQNYTPEMTELAKNNISFSQSDLIEGAAVAPACGWSIAGIIAQTSGVPLKLFKYDDAFADNLMGHYSSFLAGAVSIGELLENEGYKNFLMAGQRFGFGGGESYMTTHGNYEVWDLEDARREGKVPSDYYEWWGFEDKKLFEFGKEKITELASGEQPFNFVLITCDTHSEDGYECELCPKEYDEPYANVWRCQSKQLEDFVKWAQEQPFYENTTIVITGDHCSMDSDFYDSLVADKHYGSIERKVYNCFINAPIEPIKENNRKFTTLDMYPTILASLGVEIDGNRLGLGVNLFADMDTLAEQYGYDVMFGELNRKSMFYNRELLYK